MNYKHGNVLIGTSGWHYAHWSGPFYPPDLSEGEYLDYYAERFAAVEVNNTFYQLPEESTLARWRGQAPGDFVFAVKASRYITHQKKLKDPEGPVDNFFRKTAPLGQKRGPVLFQLPPRWRANPDRLSAFLEALPAGQRCVFEFRDRDWFRPETYAILREKNACLCIYDLAGWTSPKETTADFVYIRLHGPDSAYQGRYAKQRLSGWAGALSSWSRAGLDVYVFFDNDQNAYAATNALELKQMIGD